MQSELFDRAAECDRLMTLETDDVKKGALRLVRQMWIALANETATVPSPRLTEEIASIDKMQLGIVEAPQLGLSWRTILNPPPSSFSGSMRSKSSDRFADMRFQ